jgi:hypothetical protein
MKQRTYAPNRSRHFRAKRTSWSSTRFMAVLGAATWAAWALWRLR